MVKLRDTRYMQYVSVLTATLGITTAGTYLTWPTPTLPILVSEVSPLGSPITPDDATWIVTSVMLLPLPFTFLAGWFLDKCGRKFCMVTMALPLIFPWMIIIFAKSVLVVCIARSLAGVGLAVILIGCSMYIGEIADSDIRGRLGAALVIMKLAGSILVFSVGPFVSYVALALICMSIPMAFFVLFYFMPESPYYLVKAGKMNEAEKVIRRISPANAPKDYIDGKLDEIKEAVKNDVENRSSISELFTNDVHLKALVIVMGINAFGMLSGHGVIEPYLQLIMQMADSSITPEVSSIIFGVVPLPAVLLAGFLIDKVGRKPLLMVSAIGCGVALINEGIYFYLKDVVGSDLSKLSWLPASGFVLFQFMNSLGLGIVPFVILSEIFATNIKGQAIAVSSCFSGVLGFLLSKFSWIFVKHLGLHGCFWLFGFFCLFGNIFVYLWLPETKGKSLAEIQNVLKGGARAFK